MSVVSVDKDFDNPSMRVVAEFEAPIETVWLVWADPRRLERWWGPPGYPATVTEHDLVAGGSVRYHMTGPDGETYPGWWTVVAVDAPHRLELVDGFANDDGSRDEEMPSIETVVTLETVPGIGTRMIIESRFDSAESLQQLVEMGMEEGITAAIGQIPDLLGG